MVVPKQAGNLAYLADSLPRLLREQRDRAHRAASRTPEGHYGQSPVCREFVCVEFSKPAGDAPCPACGQLLWLRELHWPIVTEGQGLPLRAGRRVRRGPSLPRRLGRLVARVARRLATGRRPSPPPRPEPAIFPALPSSSTMYDRWVDP